MEVLEGKSFNKKEKTGPVEKKGKTQKMDESRK